VREEHWRDVEVILNQISFRDAELRPEELVEVCEADDTLVYLNVKIVFILGKLDVGDWGLAATF